jgi:hypothetical protein
MPKCPYCKNELAIKDFFNILTKEPKRGTSKERIMGFKGEKLRISRDHEVRMWVCPSCDTILGFSEFKYLYMR